MQQFISMIRVINEMGEPATVAKGVEIIPRPFSTSARTSFVSRNGSFALFTFIAQEKAQSSDERASVELCSKHAQQMAQTACTKLQT